MPTYSLQVNGERHEVEAPDDMPLLWVLRDLLGLTGTKFGCGQNHCGACTVHMDGSPIRSCPQTAKTGIVQGSLPAFACMGWRIALLPTGYRP